MVTLGGDREDDAGREVIVARHVEVVCRGVIVVRRPGGIDLAPFAPADAARGSAPDPDRPRHVRDVRSPTR